MPDTTLMLCSTMSTVRPLRHRLDQLRDALHVLVRHARRRLVEQHHLGLERERGGDLERALAPVGQLDRHGGLEGCEPDGDDQLARAPVQPVEHALRPPELEGGAARRCSAMRTFSSTVRCGNTAEIWNERTSPMRAIFAGLEPVISLPL